MLIVIGIYKLISIPPVFFGIIETIGTLNILYFRSTTKYYKFHRTLMSLKDQTAHCYKIDYCIA